MKADNGVIIVVVMLSAWNLEYFTTMTLRCMTTCSKADRKLVQNSSLIISCVWSLLMYSLNPTKCMIKVMTFLDILYVQQ